MSKARSLLSIVALCALASCSKVNHDFGDLVDASPSPDPSAAVQTQTQIVGPAAAPSDFVWVANTATSISVSWKDNATDGTGYEIESCTGSGCTGFAPVSGSPFAAHMQSYSAGSLTTEAVYRFRIRAVNANGPSPWLSSPDVVTFAGIGVASNITSSGVTLNWSPSPNAASYQVFDVTASTGSPVFVASVGAPGTSYSVTGLSASTTYSYIVRAMDANGLSDKNMVVGQVTTGALGSPAAPSSLTVAAVTPSSITISWNDNATNETSYEVEQCAGSGCTGFTAATGSPLAANTTNFTASGLASASVYRLRVRAVNGAGPSGWLTSNDITTSPLPAPAAPSNLVWNSNSAGSISFSWTDNATNESGYEIQSCAGSGCTGFAAVTGSPFAADTITHTEASLVAGGAYRFRIRAVNNGGPSAWLTSGDMVAFGGISVIDQIAYNGVRLNWNAAATAVSYQVYDVTSGSPVYLTAVNAPATAYVVPGLSATTSYTFRVRTVDVNGVSDRNTNDVAATTAALTAPSAPTGLAVSGTGSSSIQITWTNTANNASGLQVQQCQGSGCTTFADVTGSPFSPNTASFNATGLASLTSYRFQVRATNAAGNSAWLTSGDITTAALPAPAAPSNLAWSSNSGSSISFAWADNATNESSYEVQSCAGSGCSGFAAATGSPFAANTTSLNATGLAAGGAYRFRIRAVNNGGPSAWLTSGDMYSFGGIDTIDQVVSDRVRLNWTTVPNAVSYMVYNTSGASPAYLATVNAPATNYTVLGLTPLTGYKFRVRAMDAAGIVDQNTNDVSVTTASPGVPDAPTNLASAVNTTSVSLSWTDNATNETSYEVQRCAGSGCAGFVAVSGSPFAANLTVYNDGGLLSGATYRYRIRAVNGVGPSAWLTSGDITTTPVPPPAPTNLAWTSDTGTTIALSWTDNGNNETSYEIQGCSGTGCSSFGAISLTGLAPYLTAYTITGLTSGTVYRFQVRAVNSAGASAWTGTSDTVAFAGVASIDNVQSNQARINWATVASAVSYSIYDTTSGTPSFLTSVNAPATSFTATGLLPSSAYKFRVRAVDVNGVNDLNTNDVSVTTAALGAPTGPSSLTVGTVTTSSIAISWTDNATNATSYQIQRCTGSGCSGFADLPASPLGAAAASFTDTGLTNGTIYRYQVRAVNAAGGSSWLTSGDIATVTLAPPSNLVWNADTGSTVTIGWSNNAPTATSLDIQSCSSANCTGFTAVSGSPFAAATTGLTQASLTAGTGYRFRIRANDAGGSSAWLTSGNTVAFGGISSIDQITYNGMRLNWASAATAVSYQVYDVTSGTPVYLASVNAPASSYTVTGLSALTTYKYRVRTVDIDGVMDKNVNDVSGTTTALTVPADPTGLATTSTTSTSIAISWTDNANNENAYQVQQCQGSGCTSWADVTGSPFAANTTSFTANSLTASTVYRFQVRATNAAGNSGWLTSGDISTSAAGTAPNAPSNLAWTANGATSITVTWSDNATDETGYEVQSCAGSGCTGFTAVTGSPFAANTVTYTLSGATEGSVYRIRTRATNAAGQSAWLTSGDLVAFAGINSITSVGANSAQLNWNAVSNSAFYLAYDTTSGSPVLLGSIPSSGTSYTVTGLSPSTSYKFRVRSFDSTSTGDQNGNDVPVTTPAVTPPSAPTGLMLTGATTSSIGIAWTNTASNATGYAVQRCVGSGCGSFSPVTGSPFSSTTQSFADNTVTSGVVYSYRVQALGPSNSSSAWVQLSNVQASLSAPPAPSGFVLGTVTSTSIAFSWTNIATNATSVIVQRCSGTGCSSGYVAVSGSPFAPSTVSVTDTGLTPSTAYNYQIIASNSGGNSAALASGNVTTLGGSDAAASLVQVSATHVPHDNSALATIVVIPRTSAGALVGTGLTVEVTASATATVSGSAACRTPSAQCAKATDLGGGAYSVTAKSASAANVTFSAVVAGSPDLTLATAPVIAFNTANFTVVSATTGVTSANAGQNLYFTGGTATFNSTTNGLTFGDIIVNGGTVTHTTTTTATMFSLNINAASLSVQSGTISVSNIGYPVGWSWSNGGAPTGANSPCANCGGSHGGQGGLAFGETPYAPTYDDYRNPVYPGGGGGSQNGTGDSPGGGVVKIVSSGLCTIYSAGTIVANSTHGGAGGSINLQCAGFTGNAAANAIQANGGSIWNNGAGGGGGRVALISSGTKATTFTGNFAYPANATSLASFKSVVQARGGAGGSTCCTDNNTGNGGAGTVYLAGSDSTYGDLIIDNGGIQTYAEGGNTLLVSMSGTVGAAHASGTNSLQVTAVSGSAGIAGNATNLYAGMRFRPDASATSGPPDNWANDDVQVVASNDTLHLVSTTNFPAGGFGAVGAGATFRSIDVLDHIDIAGNATVETYGDLWPAGGQLATPGLSSLTFNQGFIRIDGTGALSYPGYAGTLATNFSSGTVITNATSTTGLLTVSGGSLTLTSASVTEGGVAVTGSGTLVANGNLVSTGTTTVNGSGSLTVLGSLTSTGDVTINSSSASALVTTGLNAPDLIVNAGTISHPATTTTQMYSLVINLSGTTGLLLNSGAINVSNLGFPVGWSWSNGGAPTGANSPPANSGGSHGGQGGLAFGQTPYAPTYDDYRNPMYAGGGGGNQNGTGDSAGGGVIRIYSPSGPCTIQNSAQILANSNHGGAGGTINMQCASFAGTAAANAVQANGGSIWNNGAAGGGGRVALIAGGTKASAFTGSFAYPTNPTSLSSFKTVVQARGGTGGSVCCTDNNAGNGGAGTVFLSGSDSTYGDLIVDNGGIQTYAEGGNTLLVSAVGTVSATHSSGTSLQVAAVTGSAGFTTTATNLYAGMRLRPDTSVTTGPPDNWANDDVQVVASNDTLHFTTVAGFPASGFSTINATASFRSIDILDHIDIAGSATLETYGDLWPAGGQLGTPGLSTFPLTNAFLKEDLGASLNYPGYGGLLSTTFSSGTAFTSTSGMAGGLTVTGGTLTLTNAFSVGGAIAVTGTGTLIANSNLTGSSTFNIGNAGSVTVLGTLTTSGDITVNSSSTTALVATTVNAPDFILNSGTVSHPATTTAQMNQLILNLSGTTGLLVNSGSINVSNLGYPVGWSWSSGGAPTGGNSPPANSGGSHGGQGGLAFNQTPYAPTYDDYRNPVYAGGGGGNQNGTGDSPGGGVIRVYAPNGACTVQNSGSILANSNHGGAGGTINMQCASFAGTAGANAVQANGGSIWSNGGAGGGGRVALISSGTKAGSFSGSFAYPTNSTSLASFKTVVQARGGTGGSVCCTDNNGGNGGAGTVYLAGSDSTYGDLIIDNGGIQTYAEGGNTLLVSAAGTVSAIHSSGSSLQVTAVSGSAGFTASATNLYAGMRFRPDVSVTTGPPDNWANDDVQVVSSNDTLHLVAATGFPASGFGAINSNATFRSIDILDHLDVAGSATLETYGDLWPVSGQLANPGQSTFTLSNAFIRFDGASGIGYPGYNGTLTTTFASGTAFTSASTMSGGLTVSGGSLTLTNAFSVGGALAVTGSGTLTANSNLNVSGTVNVGNAAGMTVLGTLTSSGDITINSSSTSALVATTVNAPDFILNGGTVSHPATTTAQMNQLILNLSGTTGLQLNSGSINVSNLGYPVGWSWSNGGAPTGGNSPPANSGGSHGGQGGLAFGQTPYAPTYDDYHNPIYPGGGGGSQNGSGDSPGGGVLRVYAPSGSCTINNSAQILANSTHGGAGGTINLQCASFGGTAGGAAVQANGGSIWANGAAGGGGRIALISTGTKAGSFSGSLAYPVNASTLSTFKAVVQAHGGTGGSVCCTDNLAGNGGAGTIYLAGSDSAYGDLIVDNGGIQTYAEGGNTMLVSMAGTVAATHSSGTSLQVSSTSSSAGMNSTATNLYAGMRFRPDVSVTTGPPDNWANDDVQTVSSNDTLHLVAATGFPASGFGTINATATFRSIDLLDHIDIGGSATLETWGDLWPAGGNLASPGTALAFTNGFIKEDGAASISFPSYSGVMTSSFSAGTVYSNASGTSGLLTVSGGSLTLNGSSFAAGGGVAVTGSGTLVVNGNLSNTGTINIGNSGSMTVLGTLTSSGDITINSTSTSALVATTVNAPNFIMNAGTVSHPATTTAQMYSLILNLTGTTGLLINSGAINVSNLGYPVGWSWSNGGAPTGGNSPPANSGGSHGGQGGLAFSQTPYAPTYDDFRNPIYPGGGGGSQNGSGDSPGGGVVRVFAPSGTCTIENSGQILANSTKGGAGGTINLQCGGFGGTIAASSIQANGGAIWANGAAGGGGRIALVSNGTKAATFTGNLAYPTSAASLSNLKSIVQARGGAGGSVCCTDNNAGNGGAGTIYLAGSDSTYGDLIIDNGAITTYAQGGANAWVGTTANTGALYSQISSTQVQIASAGTPIAAGLVNIYKGMTIWVAPTGSPASPLDASHTNIKLDASTANDTNHFTTSSGTFPSFTGGGYNYRFLTQLDHLDIAGNSVVNTSGGDLVLAACDLHSASATTFDVPAGSKITGISMASASCSGSAQSAEQGTTINFTNYFLQP